MIQLSKPLIDANEITAVSEVLASGQLASGQRVADFENNFKKYIGVDYAVATSSGTTALHAALLALGIGSGDMVITTPFSFIATSNAILYTGAAPKFADIDISTFNIDPAEIERTIIQNRKKIKALVIVHLFGNPCNMDKIAEICDKYGVALVEDCAQAHGAIYDNKKVGSFGKVSIFSFYPTKNITCGEGGMILTNDAGLYDNASKIINHGQNGRYNHTMLGYNFRMTDLNAAIGLAQLNKLEGFVEARIRNAGKYLEGMKNDGIILPEKGIKSRHTYNQFTIKCADRNGFIEHLQKNEIGYGIYYPATIPKQPFYKALGIEENCPYAEEVCKQVVSIPVHPGLTQAETDKVIEVVNNWNH